MSQKQLPDLGNAEEYLEETTKKLELATKEFVQATELRKALDQAGVLNPEDLKRLQDEAVTAAAASQGKAAQEVAKAQKVVLEAYEGIGSNRPRSQKLEEIRDRAVAALTKLPPPKDDSPKYDRKKVPWVLIALWIVGIVVLSLIFFIPTGKGKVIAGLVIAAIGQVVESAKKADDVQSNPRLTDGLALFGESVKILGAVTVIIGVVAEI
ncbi:hypothetical protein [Glutamicibacter sp. NPDC087673]|uniref:hypothetical protein n=1 Tax=Glutamicibacter sp. NPDC087673 TaxID=3363997 RepID=UPI003810C464